MAAKIRLKKVGRKGQASYRVVVLDGRKPRDAKVVEELGNYDPKTNPPTFEVNGDAALKWLLEGAKATKAARDILSKAGVMAAWDAAKRGEEIAIEAKELKPTVKSKKKEEPVEAAAEETAEVEAETSEAEAAPAEDAEAAAPADEAPEAEAEAAEADTAEEPEAEPADAEEEADAEPDADEEDEKASE
jgi:small subunit ribosomal protein S16